MPTRGGAHAHRLITFDVPHLLCTRIVGGQHKNAAALGHVDDSAYLQTWRRKSITVSAQCVVVVAYLDGQQPAIAVIAPGAVDHVDPGVVRH